MTDILQLPKELTDASETDVIAIVRAAYFDDKRNPVTLLLASLIAELRRERIDTLRAR